MRTSVKYLPDYANLPDDSGIPLQKVGIRGLTVKRRWNDDFIVTRQSAYVNLSDRKGIHMSRLIHVLLDWEGEPIEPSDYLLEELAVTHDCSHAYWKCKWSDIIDYAVGPRFTVHYVLEGRWTNDQCRWYFTLTMPYASVCPCSFEMVKAAGKGIPHMQRSRLTITTRLSRCEEPLSQYAVWMITDLVDELKLVPWAEMKRAEELRWCQQAEDNPMFVEDAARKAVKVVSEWSWVDDWVVVAEHEESIHDFNAVAVVWKGVELR